MTGFSIHACFAYRSEIDSFVFSRFPTKEENIKRKQKVQNQLYINAINIWYVAYKGQKSSDCLPTIGR